jgi:hypothetical protein
MAHWSHPSEASFVHGNTCAIPGCYLIGFLSVITEVFGGVCLCRQIPCFYLEVKCYLISNPYLLTMYDYLIILFDTTKRVFCYSECPDMLQGTPSCYSLGARGSYLSGKLTRV